MSRLRSLFCVLLAVVLCAVVALPSLPAAVAAVPVLVGSAASTSAVLGGAPVVGLPSPRVLEVLWARAKDTAITYVSRLLDVVFGTDAAEGDGSGEAQPAGPNEPQPNAGLLMDPHG